MEIYVNLRIYINFELYFFQKWSLKSIFVSKIHDELLTNACSKLGVD